MNILILTKLKTQIWKSNHKGVYDYIKDDQFFNGYNDGFKQLGHNTFLNWEHSFFISQKFRIKFMYFAKFLKIIMEKTAISKIDRFLFSRKIAMFCKLNSIDVIFTEINRLISPKIIRKYYPTVKVTQWYGVFPEMSDKDTLNILSEYDHIWGPCEFDLSKVYFRGIENLKYIGCGVNEKVHYYDFDINYEYDVVFVGGLTENHKNRLEMLEEVAQCFDKFAFYGYGIDSVPSHYKLREKYKGWLNPYETRKLFSSSRIVLNLTLDGYDRIKKGFNSRLFEVAACGGAMQLCINDSKVSDFFEIGKDLDIFNNKNELVDKITFYLENPHLMKQMAENSKSKSKFFTYQEKAKLVIEKITEAD